MDYRLLGPLEARAGDRAVPLGGPKQRAVLAVLLLRAGETVSVDTLIDEVWGERPPVNVTATLHNCIFRLRKAIGAEAIERRPPGYMLHARDEEIDARRFERALLAARALEPAERAAALREALSSWRGSALADLALEPFAEAEAARLEELRLVALEERIDAELALGRDDQLVAELEALVARHPLRERLRREQMLALYRARRKPEALQAFQDARLALIDELGLEPSDELRELERLMHRDDPSLEIAAEALATLEAEGDTAWLATIAARLAEFLAEAGRPEEARALAQRSSDLVVPGDLRTEAAWRRAHAVAGGAEGDSLAREAVALLESTDELVEQAKAQLALAHVLGVAGQAGDASNAKASAVNLLRQKGNEALLTRLG